MPFGVPSVFLLAIRPRFSESLRTERNFCAKTLSDANTLSFLCRFDTPGALGYRASRLSWQECRGQPSAQIT